MESRFCTFTVPETGETIRGRVVDRGALPGRSLAITSTGRFFEVRSAGGKTPTVTATPDQLSFRGAILARLFTGEGPPRNTHTRECPQSADGWRMTTHEVIESAIKAIEDPGDELCPCVDPDRVTRAAG